MTWTEVLVHDDARVCALHAAAGVLAGAEPGGGVERARERLCVGDEEAVLLALQILARSIEWRGIPQNLGPTPSR